MQNGTRVDSYARTPQIHMGLSGEYSAVEGVTTFRGNNYRDSAAYGNIPDDPEELEIVWSVAISQIDDWGGVGWTGQCAIVRWPEETVRVMNVREEKQGGPLTEVIYATLDGRIYFLDLYDGQATRPAINVGAPIKGSVTVDPRGYPLLYVCLLYTSVAQHTLHLPVEPMRPCLQTCAGRGRHFGQECGKFSGIWRHSRPALLPY